MLRKRAEITDKDQSPGIGRITGACGLDLQSLLFMMDAANRPQLP